MQFVSLTFLVFLLVTVSIYFVIPKKVRYIWLLLASAVFYFMAADKLLILLAAVCLVTYVAGILMDKSEGSKKPILITGIVLLVGTLGFFKYTGFLLDTIKNIQGFFGAGEGETVFEIVIPVGISFYIFQAIGYLVDCYRRTIQAEKNPLKLSLFISFFPQITSGPIERAGNMIPQYSNPKDFDYDRMRDGLLLMMWGYFQKMIIADRLATIVKTVYSSYENYSGTVLFLATVFYTIEIYCDFAGYSNIAIGSAKIMGIDIMQNFRQPYLAGSIAEFWRRWHISLSSWLRDYIYIPLGGNRKGQTRKLVNILIVFAISGLWHGAAWTFVVWGLLHGLYQVVGALLKPVRDRFVEVLRIERESSIHKAVKIFVTFMLVNIGWVFFRAADFKEALYFIGHMWKPSLWVLFDGTLFTLGLTAPEVRLLIVSIILLVIVDILNNKGISVSKAITTQKLPVRWVIYIAAVVFIVTCGVWGPGYDAASFIYSNF